MTEEQVKLLEQQAIRLEIQYGLQHSSAGNPFLQQIGNALGQSAAVGGTSLNPYPHIPLGTSDAKFMEMIEQAKQNAKTAIERKTKDTEEAKWQGFQQGIRMATEQLTDTKERARAWDGYVLGLLARGFSTDDSIARADALLSERDGRFSLPKN